MPIKGLTNQRRITRGGFIRLGVKVKNAKGIEYPQKIDYFLPDFEDEELVQTYHKIYGEKPRRITIAFANDNPEHIFPQYYKCYGASAGLKCKGDGEVAQRIVDGQLVEVDCPEPMNCDYALDHGKSGNPGCKKIGSLQFFIKGIPGLQVFQINTSSYHSILNLNSGIELLQRLRSGKPIFGVWVELRLAPQVVQPHGKKVTIYAMKLHFNVDLDGAKGLTSVLESPLALPPGGEDKDELLFPSKEAQEAQEEADWENDTDVTHLLHQLGFSAEKCRAIIDKANKENWDKDRIMSAIQSLSPSKEPEEDVVDVKAEPVTEDDLPFDDDYSEFFDDEFGMPEPEPETKPIKKGRDVTL